MDRKDTQERIRAVYSLLLEEKTTREKFESIRTLIKGINPQIDKTLAQTFQALTDYEKLHKGEFIELTIEKLPEVTEEEKKRKKALLFLIRSWKQLQSEVERAQQELDKSQQKGDKPQNTWSNILKGAKGPLGIITICAVVIVGFLLFTNKNKQTTSQPANVSTQTKIQAIEYQGKKIPLTELQTRQGPDCVDGGIPIQHYHARNHVSVTARDQTTIQDPGGCAFGKVKEVKVIEVTQ